MRAKWMQKHGFHLVNPSPWPTLASLGLWGFCVQVGGTAAAVWPAASVALFGSQPAGLALPASDLDLVVLDALPGLESRCATY